MHGHDPYLLAALGCLIVAALVGLGAWGFDLWRVTDEEERYRRSDYQGWINETIIRMIDGVHLPTSPKQLAEYEDLQWHLHSLLYEYRNGIPAKQGGALIFEVDRNVYG